MWENIIWWTHFLTLSILTTWCMSACMYRFLSNIQDGASSLEYCLWNYGQFCSYRLWLRPFRVARVQDTDKFVDKPLGCHCRGVSVNDATLNVTTFAVPRLCVFLSGLQHRVPGISHNISYWLRVRNTNSNLDELFASGINLAYPTEHSFIFVNGSETEVPKVKLKRVNCPLHNFVRNGQNIGRIHQFWSAIRLLKKLH